MRTIGVVVVIGLAAGGVAHADRVEVSAQLSGAARTCRDGAGAVRAQVEACRAATGGCSTLKLKRKDGSEVILSVDDAAALADRWDAHAGEIEAHVDEVQALETQEQAEETAIRALGFDKRAEDFVEWEKASEELHSETIKLTLEALWDASVGFASRATRYLMQLRAKDARKLVAWWKQLGADNPDFLALVGKLYKVKSQKKKIELVAAVIRDAEKEKDLILMDADREGWASIASKLRVFYGWFTEAKRHSKYAENPFTKVVVADIRLAASLVWGALTERAIDGLTRLTEADLKSLRDHRDRAVAAFTKLHAIVDPLDGCVVP